MSEYIINDTTLKNIADAIREKAEITKLLYPENMPSYIRSIKTSTSTSEYDYPDYVVEEGKRVATSMISKQGGNSLTAVIISDTHEMGDTDHTDATIIERYRRANLNAGQGAKVIADNIDLDFFAHLGDFAWGSKTSTIMDFTQSIVNVRGYINDITQKTETFLTPGNHDPATYGFAHNNEYFSQGMCNGLIGTYRYVDFASKKVRVICLNTAEVEGLTVSGESGTERITGTQLQWFADTLDLSDKSDASQWGIVIISHHPLDWGNILPAANCLQAYLTGGSYSVTHNGVAVSKNFSGKNSAKVICQFHGHVHGFKVDNIRYGSVGSLSATTVKRIAIPNACFARTNEYGENTGTDSNGLEFGETTSYDKTDNCAENTAFCLVSIDLNNKVIYADCYGAGYDRVVSYGGGVYTNLVPTSVATDGVTIFGEDYNEDGYPDGYRNGAYISSSGSYGTDANCVATGCIYMPTDVQCIYIKGAELRTSGTSANHVRLYVGSVDTTHSYTTTGDGSTGKTFDGYFTVETLGTNYYKLTLNSTALTYFRGRYYRVSLIGTGDNLIITHDEPIE